MTGYDPSFLGISNKVPLPTFSDALQQNTLTAADMPTTDFQDENYTRYIHFSIATNKRRRQPIVVALNIDQAQLQSVKRGSWTLDDQVGRYQLDNSYYRNNDYDRGHLARRASSAWGPTEDAAFEGSQATMVYSNAALQHAAFNQDEWLALESWVLSLELDATDRISVFSGPIYTSRRAATKFIGEPPAQIPTAFFKVVCFVDKTGAVATRAFVMSQDREALSDKSASRRMFDLGVYQVPVKMIEDETGLVFDDVVKNGNPLGFIGVEQEPEIIAVTRNTMRTTAGDGVRETPSYTRVYILSAMVSPRNENVGNEWVSISNFDKEDLNLTGWKISNLRNEPVEISGTVRSGEAKRVTDLKGVILSNIEGTIALIDPSGNIADRVMYSPRTHQVKEDTPIIFHIEEGERGARLQ